MLTPTQSRLCGIKCALSAEQGAYSPFDTLEEEQVFAQTRNCKNTISRVPDQRAIIAARLK